MIVLIRVVFAVLDQLTGIVVRHGRGQMWTVVGQVVEDRALTVELGDVMFGERYHDLRVLTNGASEVAAVQQVVVTIDGAGHVLTVVTGIVVCVHHVLAAVINDVTSVHGPLAEIDDEDGHVLKVGIGQPL